MSNPSNNGTVIGHLADAPKFMPHSNGVSGTAMFTVYAQNNYITKSTGQREAVRIDFEDYIADRNNVGPYAYMKQGMLVAINYAIKNADYTDKKTGEKRFGMKLVVERNGITILDSKQTTAEREARKNTAQAQGFSAPQAQAQAPAQGFAPAQAQAPAPQAQDQAPAQGFAPAQAPAPQAPAQGFAPAQAPAQGFAPAQAPAPQAPAQGFAPAQDDEPPF